MDFTLRMTPHVKFGRGVVEEIGKEVKELGGKRVFVVCDKGVYKTGIVDRIVSILKSENLSVLVFSDVIPEPPTYIGDSAADAAKEFGADCVVGVGGGSSMDVAKAVSVLITNEGCVEDYQGVNKVPKKGVPKVVVPTTAGTGSEVTWTAVFSNPGKKTKGGINSPYLYPDLAILDPLLTLSLPPLLTASTGLDALTHAIESFIGKASTPFTENMSLGAIKIIFDNLPKAVLSPDNVDAREKMLYGSFLAGIALSNAGVGAVHAMAYPLGAIYNVPHGAANSILLPYVMEFNKPVCIEKFSLAMSTLETSYVDMAIRDAADAFVEELYNLKDTVGLRMTLGDFGVERENIPKLAVEAMKVDRPIANNPRKITEEDIVELYEEAFEVEYNFDFGEDMEEV